MKITIYNVKGSAGKTPIAVNIALDRGYAIGTNEPFHVLDAFIPDDILLSVIPEEAFPKIPDDIDIVFDLAGSISKSSISIPSALSQSDLVIVPIYNEVKSIHAGIHTILEVAEFTKNIIVVATKLKKHKKDVFKTDWTKSKDFLNIKMFVDDKTKGAVDGGIPVLPLKFSTAFDDIFEKELSISQIMSGDALLNNSYRGVNNQFNELYKVIDNYGK